MLYSFSTTTTYHKNDRNEWTIYNWLNTSYAILDDTTHPLYVFLENNRNNKIHHIDESIFVNHLDDLEYLISCLILTDDQEKITHQIKTQYELSRKENQLLSLILLPAGEACNFNCVYCYEDHSNPSRMGDHHLFAIESLIKATDANNIQVEYFGGEPLLNAKFILNLHKKILDWTKEFPEKKFYSSATTNGYLLTPELIDSLYQAKVHNFQITLDGLAHHHDKLRPLANGRGSFEQITKNLANIVARKDLENLRIMIRVNFNESTSSENDIHQFLDFIQELIGQDQRFSILFRSIGDYAANNNRNTDANHICSSNNVDTLRHEYENQAAARGLITAESDICLAFGASSCYAAKPNNFVISPDWSIKKCTVALDRPHNNVGHLNRDGTLFLNEHYYNWIAPRLFSKKECSSCHFVTQCHSNACPLHNMEKNVSICPPQKFTPVRFVEQLLSKEKAI